MKHHETVVILCDDIGARCGDFSARCGDVCIWGSDVGDRTEVIRCDDIGARCGDVVAFMQACFGLKKEAHNPHISVVFEY